MSRSILLRPFYIELQNTRAVSLRAASLHANLARATRRRIARTGLGLALALCATMVTSGAARADEFSPVPAGDPIYRQLRALDSSDLTTGAAGVTTGLTRYEAALQVARIITRVSNDSSAQLSRVGWRALRDLSGALKGELTQLGVDVAAAQKLADERLKAPESARPKNTNDAPLDLSTPAGFSGASRAFPSRIARGAAGDSLFSGGALNNSTLIRPGDAAFGLGLQNTEFSSAIVPRLRVGAALLAMQRAENDPFRSASAGQSLLSSSSSSRVLGSNTSVDYDVTSWLSVRALSSRRSLDNQPDVAPFLRDPFFNNATEARSTGGGLGIDMGAFTFSTKVERLSTDTGARGTSVDSGVRLSAWQNRLSLSAHLARLQPEDNTVLESTRRELNIGLNVSQRLSLNLFYQGLFTQQNVASSERVTGGLNLSF